ncbi:MAG: hypothetical protein K0S47_3446 [Herbinix sp.]|jgi:predicted ATP-dependent Lon-type protease|nr:hypothetical protein [Herbinix sp.]
MRKKSHISLARFLMNNMQVKDLNEHKKAFYIGSILPDCTPSFLTKRHTIDETFDKLIKEIRKITVDYDVEKGLTGYYARHLGVITHYLADYFTFPHNSIFDGNIKEHCIYEKELKITLKSYVESDEAQRIREQSESYHTIDEILRFINQTHKEYIKVINNLVIKEVKEDIQYIVDLCYRVVDALLKLFELAYAKFHPVQPIKLGHNVA